MDGGVMKSLHALDVYPSYATNGSLAFRISSSSFGNISLSATGGTVLEIEDQASVSGNFSVDTDVLYANTSTNRVGINTKNLSTAL